MQPSEPKELPTQSAPDPCGVGLVQVRVRVRVPPPQVSEQLDHDVHCDQPPLTACDDHVIISSIRPHPPLVVPPVSVLQLAPVKPSLHEHWLRSLHCCIKTKHKPEVVAICCIGLCVLLVGTILLTPFPEHGSELALGQGVICRGTH